jgi:Tfp pilus assembly protein PilN
LSFELWILLFMVEIIPKQTQERPVILNILTYGVVALVLIVGGVFLYLWQEQTKVTAVLHQLEIQVAAGKTKEELQLERFIFGIRDRLHDFETLIQERKDPNTVFVFLETVTHPQVFFSKAHAEPFAYTIELTGEAVSFRALDEQMVLLRAQEQIQGVQMSNITIGKTGRVKFNLDIIFQPTFFKKQEQLL